MGHLGKSDAGYDVEAPKKRINVTVNEDLVHLAQGFTDNLSGTIEALLAAWTRDQCRKRENDEEHRRKVVAAWNAFDGKHGRFADEWNGDFLPADEDR